MALKGQRKFICLDCEEETYFSTKERCSHFRIKCRWCGSTAIEPSPVSKVKKEIQQESTNKKNPYLKKATI